MKKHICTVLLFITVMVMGAFSVSAATVSAEKPTLSSDSIVLNIYGLKKTGGVYYAENNSVTIENVSGYEEIRFKSSSKNLKVSESWDNNTFYLNPKKPGQYTVSFFVGDVELTCKVNVVKAYFTRNSKSLNDETSKKWIEGLTTLALYKGETATLKANNLGKASAIKWTSSDKSVASVDKSGKVTGKNYGYALITAEYKGIRITYNVEVSYKTVIKALRYAKVHYSSTYSQPRRMDKGYYDCSSYVWRSYIAAGLNIGRAKGYAPTAAELARWCENNGYMIMEGTADVSGMLPGDLIFWTGADNGRYHGIYHVDLYSGNYVSMTVARSKYYGGTISGVMVARPCLGSASVPKGQSSVFSNYIKWSEADSYGASGYNVYRSSSSNGVYQYIGKAKNKNYYDDTKVKNGDTFYYKIRAYWSSSKKYYGKQGNGSSGVRKKTGSPSFELSSAAEGVKVSWDKVPGAEGYYVYRWNTKKWKKVATVTSGKKGSAADVKTKDAATYKYMIRAYRGKEVSGYVQKGKSIKFLAPPAIRSVTNTLEGIKIKWKKSSGISVYRVYRKISGGKWRILTDIKGTSYIDQAVASGKKYSYAIQCLDKKGDMAKSGYLKTAEKYQYIAAPVINKLTSTENGMQVTWQKIKGAVNYRVYKKTAGGSWKKLVDTKSTSILDANVSDGIQYFYRIRCINVDGTENVSAYFEYGTAAIYKKPVTEPEEPEPEEPEPEEPGTEEPEPEEPGTEEPEPEEPGTAYHT